VLDLACPFVELHEIPVGPFLQLAEVLLNGSTTIWSISNFSKFSFSANWLKVHLVPSARSLMKAQDLHNTGLSNDSWHTQLMSGHLMASVLLVTAL